MAKSPMLAGLQVIFGYFAVAPPAPVPSAVGPFAAASPAGKPRSEHAGSRTNVSFVVRPPNIANRLWLVFRGTRDMRTGCLVGEIVPDVQMRVLGLALCASFGIVGCGATIASVLVPLAVGGQPDFPALVWILAVVFTIVWTRSYGAAAHAAALNVRRDSSDAVLVWRLGLRCGSPPIAPPPPPSQGGRAAASSGPGGAVAAWAHDREAVPSRFSVWLGLVGLAMPIAIVMIMIVPAVRSRDDRSEWVRVDGVVGAGVDLDDSRVTYVLPDGTEKTSTVSVMRTVEEGDTIDLYYPPGRPDLIEQDRSGFVLPYVVFGGFALLTTALILGRFIIGLRRLR